MYRPIASRFVGVSRPLSTWVILLTWMPIWGCSPSTERPEPIPLYAQEQYVAGMVALHEARFEEAEKAAREAVAQAPDYVDGQVLLAETLLKQGKTSEAATLLDALIERHPHAPAPWTLRGMVHELNGDLPRAQQLYRSAQATYDTANLTREQAEELAVVSYLALGRLAGFKVLDDAHERFPGDHQLMVTRSQIAQDQRDFFLQRARPEPPAPVTDSSKE